MMTCGLSHTDLRTFEAVTGLYRKFCGQVRAHYRAAYGADSQQEQDCLRGTQAEPKVALAVFQAMLAARPRILVLRNMMLREVAQAGGRVEAAVFAPGGGKRVRLAARQFIDASYEGDLMAAAGVPYRTGREGRGEYDEPLAPLRADGQLQGYNFRLLATREPANRVTPGRPEGYRREEFAGVLPLLEDGRIARVFDKDGRAIFKAQIPRLPNGKYDINDVSHSAVRLSLPGENLGWPEGDAAERRRIFEAHLRWCTGLLYFLQNDEATPARFRDEAREWGWCRDEFAETGHLPPQLYVREARRMRGARVFTERDTDYAPGDARAVFHRDAIAMGDYGPNCHGTGHEGGRFGGRHTGEFYKPVAAYQIPYGTLVPERLKNLLVAGAVSASHVGFCALRLEPIWMSLGEAAGHAAHEANLRGVAVQETPAAAVQRRLHRSGAATIYVSDVAPEDPRFAAVQWWGQRGGWHGVAPAPERPGQRGRLIVGQYFEAFPGHGAELERPLEDSLRARWEGLAREAGAGPALREPKQGWTRGAFVEAAFRGRR
jgi:hypothetical protein